MGKQYGLLVDIGTCIGCKVCMVACKQANDLDPSNLDVPGSQYWNDWINVIDLGPLGNYPDLQIYHLPITCQHCENPVCAASCPVEAISKLPNGVVHLDKNRCDGCLGRSDGAIKCISACPYQAFQINPKTHKAEGCTLCLPLITKGLQPACVRACPGGCLTFGDLNDPGTFLSRRLKEAGDRAFHLRTKEGTRPSFWYVAPERMNAAGFSEAQILLRTSQILF